MQWIDSCCIDKASSAELSEAINSMFDWYRRAEVCYAYLTDVNLVSTYHSTKEKSFRNSAWFTRGWTLQELLAPQWVEFYDVNWKEIGTKSSLAPLITSITGIAHLFKFTDASIAQKMSWASKRQTTRIEDQSYCLLGLFGVHMPPLYGEGKNAFHRLQMEIISQSDDESIFAWHGRSNLKVGLLATSPQQFKLSGNIVRGVFDFNRQTYSMTNQGLRLELLTKETTNGVQSHRQASGKMVEGPRIVSERTFIAPLNCIWDPDEADSNTGNLRYVGLPLCKSSDLSDTRFWFRQGKLEPFESSEACNANNLPRTIIYAETLKSTPVFSRPQTVVVRISTQWKYPFSVCRMIKPPTDAHWSVVRSEGHVLTSFYKSDEVAALVFKDETSAKFALILRSSAFVFSTDLIVDGLWLDQVSDQTDEGGAVTKSIDKPVYSEGAGDRIFKRLSDGRIVSAMTKKELRAASYRFVVDITISRSGKVAPGQLEFTQFHLGELILDGSF